MESAAGVPLKSSMYRKNAAASAEIRGQETRYAGSDHALFHCRVFRRGVPLCQSLPEVEVIAMRGIMDFVGLALSVLLFAYLIAAMLYPEKF